MKTAKQKKIVLTIKEKLEILELIKADTSYTVITEKFGIGSSTVSDKKKSTKS